MPRQICAKPSLLAEDNELNREILKELIRETGISIEEAVNGKEAVRLVQNNPEDYFDLVFMDVQMPEMDGYETAGRIRQYEKKLKRKHLPIIALTANVFAEDSERARVRNGRPHGQARWRCRSFWRR